MFWPQGLKLILRSFGTVKQLIFLAAFGRGAGISGTPPSIQEVCSFLLRMLLLYEMILCLSIVHYTTSAL